MFGRMLLCILLNPLFEQFIETQAGDPAHPNQKRYGRLLQSELQFGEETTRNPQQFRGFRVTEALV